MINISINIEHLFNLVNQRTLYIADQIDAALGAMMIDKVPITEDDRTYFNTALRDASVRVALKFSALSKGLDVPFTVDETNGVVVFRVDETRSSTQAAILETVLPGMIMRAIMLWIVSDWLRIKGVSANYYVTESQELETLLNEIKSLSKQKTARIKYMMY